MSGHSKWATTKHRKAAQDKKRAALFSKLSKAITVAAKSGGEPNPDNNAGLAAAIAKAKTYSLPKDKIEGAIQKAFGGSDGVEYEEVIYEGYGPSGVAILVEALTDNRNRTAADVRSIFTRVGGNLGATGSVGFQFERKGQIVVPKAEGLDEDELLLIVADAGGEDMEVSDTDFLVFTAPSDVMAVNSALEVAGITVKGAELIMEPTSTTQVPVSDAKKVLNLVDALEDSDDVQSVYHTLELTDELAAALEE